MSNSDGGNFFVNRPIVAMVIAIVTVIVGVVFMLGLPVEQYPNITPPMVRVSTTYTGANALNIEKSVATPLEQEVNGVENMIYMKSVNSNDGRLSLDVSFEIGSDPDMSTVFTQNRVAQGTPKLPADVKQFGVKTEKALSFPMMLVSVTSPGDVYDQKFLGNFSIINIKDVLARIKGMGKVEVFGASDYSMRIWVKPDILAKMGISIPEIADAIRNQSVIVPGGKFGAEPAPPGTEFTFSVQLPDRLQSEEEFGDILVRTNQDGSQVRIHDIARVELGIETYNAFTRLNGKTCAALALYQTPGSNAVEIANEVRTVMQTLKAKFPEGVDYKISLDTTSAITAGIEEIIVSLIIALLLVILVVFLFIQDWRASLIPTIAIPVSLVGAFIVFPLLGFTINVLSLLGLVLAIGIVVDDAIVVVEAVQVNISKGMKAKEATTLAMKEVTAPIIATTLVLVAVFVPVAAMGGITGRLYQQFAITIAVSVLFSSFNALSLSPALCGILLKEPKPYKGLLGSFFGGFNKTFDRTTESYMSFTNVISRKITRGLVFIGIITAGIFVVSLGVPGGFLPEEDQGYFFVNAQMPSASSLQRSDEVAKQIEEVLNKYPEIEYHTTVTGFSMLSGGFSTNNSFIFVALKDWAERDLTALEITRKINRDLSQIKGGLCFSFGPPAIPGLGSGSGFTMMIQDKTGQTPEYLAKVTGDFIGACRKRPEIGQIYTTFQATVPQKFMRINTEKALKTGVSLSDIYTTVGSFLGGTYVNDFNRFGRQYKAYIQAEPEYRRNEEGMNMFFVRNNSGKYVPLASLAQIENIQGPEFTNRYNLFRAAEIGGSPAPGYSSAQALSALEEVSAQVLPAGMGYDWGNMSYQEKKAAGGGNIVFVFSLLFVFLILAAQYESWSLPLSILLGTPFAVFGAFLALYLSRLFSESYESNIFAQISLVMLIAMAAKNAILIIEFANQKFESGMSLFDSAIEAARLRFRPILMTAFSFILGVFPLIVASGSGSEARKVMGMALLGGMSVATFLGVFLTPMLFIFIGKVANYEKKREEKLSMTTTGDD